MDALLDHFSMSMHIWVKDVPDKSDRGSSMKSGIAVRCFMPTSYVEEKERRQGGAKEDDVSFCS